MNSKVQQEIKTARRQMSAMHKEETPLDKKSVSLCADVNKTLDELDTKPELSHTERANRLLQNGRVTTDMVETRTQQQRLAAGRKEIEAKLDELQKLVGSLDAETPSSDSTAPKQEVPNPTKPLPTQEPGIDTGLTEPGLNESEPTAPSPAPKPKKKRGIAARLSDAFGFSEPSIMSSGFAPNPKSA